LQHVGDAACLLVLDQGRSEVQGVERRVHDVDVAQQARAAAARDLAAGEVFRQAFSRSVGRSADDHGLHFVRVVFSGGCAPAASIMAARANGDSFRFLLCMAIC
jgi:hypothetical protein